jgi:hypothetical protein
MSARIHARILIGGFGKDSCYRMHRKRHARCMQTLQRPCLQAFTLSR